MEHDVAPPGQQEWSAPHGASRQEQFTAFMAAAEPALSRLAWLLTGERHRAEELVQLALARTWAAWPRARAGDPLGYARRVLVNARTDTWRARRREVPLGDHHDPARLKARTTASPAQQLAERDALVRALRALPVRRRRVVVLRYLMDLPEQQVADDLGISVGTVKSTAARGLAQLRDLLKPPSTPAPPAAPSPPSEARR